MQQNSLIWVTFLANIHLQVSGIRVLGFTEFTRRDRFVLGAALSVGLGNLLVPQIFTHLFDRVHNPGRGLQGLISSITIVLNTPCKLWLLIASFSTYMPLWAVLCAGIIGVTLNLILPQDVEDKSEMLVVDDSGFDEKEKHESSTGS